jgi:hypothetical protein
MLRYKLRTLLILMAVLPPVLGMVGAFAWREYREWRRVQVIRELLRSTPSPELGGIFWVTENVPPKESD